jgi:hypothetical protein
MSERRARRDSTTVSLCARKGQSRGLCCSAPDARDARVIAAQPALPRKGYTLAVFAYVTKSVPSLQTPCCYDEHLGPTSASTSNHHEYGCTEVHPAAKHGAAAETCSTPTVRRPASNLRCCSHYILQITYSLVTFLSPSCLSVICVTAWQSRKYTHRASTIMPKAWLY